MDFPVGDDKSEGVPASSARLELAAAATAVSRELYRRGMLSAAWEVGPAMAAAAIEGGHVQRALVRRRPRAGRAVAASGGGAVVAAVGAGAAGSATGGRSPEQRSGCCIGGVGGGCREEDERAALRVMRRLSGSEGVRVRRGGGVFPWGSGAESCIEVLLPAPGLDPPASSA